MDNDLKCPICGNPTSTYMGMTPRKDRLCRSHAKMLKEGTLKIGKDGTYYEVTEETIEENKAEKVETTCLLCENNSEGKHFCKSCYHKYASKKITVVISNCKTTEIIDEYGNRQIKCDNGLYVRSAQEKIIADELFKRGVRCIYEKSFPYKKEDGEVAELHPDFYLPDYDLYIEHWGFSQTEPEYLKKKAYKEKIFKAQGALVVGTSKEDIGDISSTIGKILLQYEDRYKK